MYGMWSWIPVVAFWPDRTFLCGSAINLRWSTSQFCMQTCPSTFFLRLWVDNTPPNTNLSQHTFFPPKLCPALKRETTPSLRYGSPSPDHTVRQTIYTEMLPICDFLATQKLKGDKRPGVEWTKCGLHTILSFKLIVFSQAYWFIQFGLNLLLWFMVEIYSCAVPQTTKTPSFFLHLYMKKHHQASIFPNN